MAIQKTNFGQYGFSGNKSPLLDGGLGLVMRINVLLNKIDRCAPLGEFNEWNFLLDRVFINLCYRNPLEYEIEKGRCVRLKLSDDDMIMWKEFVIQMKEIKRRMNTAIHNKDRKNLEIAKEDQYNLLFMKDIWLRKLAYEMGIYLKEVEFNPANAMFGG